MYKKKSKALSPKRAVSSKGQTVVEYILMVAVALAMLGILASGFLRVRNMLWQRMICDVAAACPTCQADPSVRNRLYPAACR